MKHSLFLASFLLFPLAFACTTSTSSSGGSFVGGSIVDGVYVVHLSKDVQQVWPVAQTVVSDMSLQLVEVDQTIRMVKGEIDGATVIVSVEPYDVDKTILQVRARKYLLSDNTMAKIVGEKIQRKLGLL